jgi:hypothetical protein
MVFVGRQVLGNNMTAWIQGKQRHVYASRIVTKGKNKGKVEVTYLRRFNKDGEPVYRKAIL